MMARGIVGAVAGSLVALLDMGGARDAVGEPVRSTAEDERQIRHLEEEITRAVVSQDPEAYDRLLPDDYTTVGVLGLLRTKAEVVEDARRKAGRSESVSQDDVRISLYGDAAVVRAVRRSVGGTLRGRDVSGRIRTLRVYVFRDGRWQPVAFQMTRIAE